MITPYLLNSKKQFDHQNLVERNFLHVFPPANYKTKEMWERPSKENHREEYNLTFEVFP